MAWRAGDAATVAAVLVMAGVLGAGLWITQREHTATAGSAPAIAGEEPLEVQSIEAAERLMTRVSRGEVLLIDARPASAFASGHIPGAISLPRGMTHVTDPTDLRRTHRSQGPIVVYCSSETCPDARAVVDWLTGHGVEGVRVLQGGWDTWRRIGGPVEMNQAS